MGLRSISLFSGIAGLDRGVKLACPDVRTICYVERDEFCQRVLRARMADGSIDDAPIWSDITDFDGRPWRGRVDLLLGGFPCQDISNAGKRLGIDGERSGLWREYARIIREVRPNYVFVENVSALLGRGLERVLGDLAESGFDAEWLCLRASDVGAPHRRERVFILAYAQCLRRAGSPDEHISRIVKPRKSSLANPERQGLALGGSVRRDDGEECAPAERSGDILEHAAVLGRREGRTESGVDGWRNAATEPGGAVGDSDRNRRERTGLLLQQGRARQEGSNLDGPDLGVFPPGPDDAEQWRAVLGSYPELAPAIAKTTEPYFRRVVDGRAFWVDPAGIWRVRRLRALGNAVVPQQAALAFAILWRRMQEGVIDAEP